MEESELDWVANKRPARRALRTSRQAKTSTRTDVELHATLSGRIAELLRTKRIKIVPVVEREADPDQPMRVRVTKFREKIRGDQDDVERFIKSREQRDVVEGKIPLEKLLSGTPSEFLHNGIGYVIHPYMKSLDDYLLTLGCHPQVQGKWLSMRDTIVWMLWTFRDKALILTGRLTSKVKFLTSECSECGHRYSSMRQAQDRKPLGCPRCGCRRHKNVTPNVIGKPIGRITKRGLRRRFRISERQLNRILSAVLRPHEPDAEPKVSSPVSPGGSKS